jgi:hypothetical protein
MKLDRLCALEPGRREIVKAVLSLVNLAVLGVFASGAVPSWAQTVRVSKPTLPGVTVEVRTDRQAYVLGETVEVEILARNGSSRPIAIPGGFDVWQGYVGVMVAFEDGPFREYRGPGWGLHDVALSSPLVMGPKQTVATSASILFNHGVPSGHLNAETAAAVSVGYLADGYALPVPGQYRIKAVLHGAAGDDAIESEPVEVAVEEPAGEDREVWNVLRSDPELGYFMQAGGPRSRSSELRRQHLVSVLERLMTHYPASRHAEILRERLSRHQDLVDDLTRRGLIAR